MEADKSGQRGFTLIELLIVVAILGILAAVVIPNVGRFLGRGQDEARRTEFQNVAAAVTALMTENKLAKIPAPYATADTPCTTGTKTMTNFPDATSSDTVPASPNQGKLKDPNGISYDFNPVPAGVDKTGYRLYAHDITADSSDTTLLINYLSFNKSSYCYTVLSDGTVRQWTDAGVEQVN